MSFTKGYISWFDGFQGVVVDYLDNQIDFHVSNVPESIVPYLQANTQVIIEENDGTLFVTLPEESFDRWEEEQKELHSMNTMEIYE
jgi:hypothetical protein